ncbi:unnamed protein product [Pocillopora meandrina]|uniref:Uncharacterized protein n=1 Tax=Pocillopora meandrina TaxID=46732 RepID=A0AAU9XGM3_9CNID|nr:unnamed protein product [Pocillopora meandrina]
MEARLLLIGSFLVALTPLMSLSCLPCKRVQCSPPTNCKGGVVNSRGGCCSVCAKVEGELCGGQLERMGRCDAGLKCVVRGGHHGAGVGTCKPAVCKGKKCGFREICTLGNDGFPMCSCSQSCAGFKHEPVCGFCNGKQYSNECELLKDECLSGNVIGIMRGICKKCYHGTKTYLFGETRTGKDTCESCTCSHGEWKCHYSTQCQKQKSRSCQIAVLGKKSQSDCPRGFFCKVQIPGIPEANIPDVAVCVPDDSSNIGEGSAPAKTTVPPPTLQLQGNIPGQCLLPHSEGPCRAAFQRWYYNKERRKCITFLYGGCEGNANNFYTKSACKVFCMQQNRSSAREINQKPSQKVDNHHTTVSSLSSTSVYSLPSSTSAPVVTEVNSKQKERHTTLPTKRPQVGKAKCHDSPSNKLYGEDETWEPNDCTVCVCRNGTSECLATVCRHPDCKDPFYIRGQCCPVCPLTDSTTSGHTDADLIKALAKNKLDTVLVSINHGKRQGMCRDIRSGQYYLMGQTWQLDQCTTCYCGKSGKAACAVQMCERDPPCKDLLRDNSQCCPKCKDDNVVKSTSKCYDTVTKKYYREAEMWQRDECTSCYCGSDRKPECTQTTCPPVFCRAPLKIEQRCCLVCPDTIQQGCVYDGQKFLHGDLKLLRDQCTLCKCDNGDWHCAKDSCLGS